MKKLTINIGIVFWSILSLPVEASLHPHNFHQVTPELYRSAQPSSQQMQTLRQEGIRTVLNLRQVFSDKPEARGTSLILYQVAMNPAVIRRDELIKALRIIHYSVKPVLVHCWHGSDRTGLVVALYELAFYHATREEVLAELRTPGYGYHATLYPGIVRYIETVNVDALRQSVINSQSESSGEDKN